MKERLQTYKGLGGFGTLGLEMFFSILFGLFGGRWLDGRFHTEPWFMWGGIAFGVAMCVRAIQRALKLMRADAEREEREHGNPAPLYESRSDRELRLKEKKFRAKADEASAAKEEAP